MDDAELLAWLRQRVADVDPDPPVAFSPIHWKRQLDDSLHGVVDELDELSAATLRSWPTVTRQTVRTYTERALESPSSIQRAFVVVMVWGGGPPAADGDRRQPWRTTMALATPGAVTHLRDAVNAVRDGQLSEALRLATQLNRLGTSFATKWLWAINGPSQAVAALVMDARVAETLRTFGRGDLTVIQSTPGSAARQRYVAYCEAATRWATSLGVAPDLVERALFSGPTGR